VAAAAVAGSLVLAGAGGGYPADRVRLLSGSAWLPSARVGQLTLLDGVSAEVAAQVEVAAPGNRLDVVQQEQGLSAYAVNRTAGTLRRVDGATFEPGPAVKPLDRAGDGLRAFATRDTVYAVDTHRGLYTDADPHTLAPGRPPAPLAAQITPEATALDPAGRLWVFDTANGDLTSISRGQRHTRPRAAPPGPARLVIADDAPVLVSLADRTATAIDPGTGRAGDSINVDLRPDDQVEVSGSPHAPRLYVVASRGLLMVCDLTNGCADAVPLAAQGAQLGAAVESGDRVFVPDYSTGRVWIVDLKDSRVVARPQVLTPRTRFQLLARDGVVFFNDPNTERAGVVHLDGGVRRIAKYDPADPRKGLTGGPDKKPTPHKPAKEPLTPQPPAPTAAPTNRPAVPPTSPPGLNPPNPPAPNPPANPRPTLRPTLRPTPRPTPRPTTTTPAPLPRLRITRSTPTPQVDEQVTLRVTAETAPNPTNAHWTFGDGQTANGLTTTHRWATAGTFQVSVQATFADGRTATASMAIDVTPATVQLRGVEVNAPAINFIFEPSGTMTVGQDLASPIPLPTAVGDGFLQSRTFARPGQPGTVGAGLYPYNYRIALDNLTVARGTPCIASLSIDFGPVVPLDFDGNGQDEDFYVITSGGLGTIKPSSAKQTGNRITFSFATPVCANDGVQAGETSFFFGLASRYPKKPVTARLTDTANATYDIDGLAPAYP
jgi:hypothetical protein